MGTKLLDECYVCYLCLTTKPRILILLFKCQLAQLSPLLLGDSTEVISRGLTFGIDGQLPPFLQGARNTRLQCAPHDYILYYFIIIH